MASNKPKHTRKEKVSEPEVKSTAELEHNAALEQKLKDAEPLKAPPPPGQIMCECPNQHDLTNKAVRGEIAAGDGIPKRYFLKCSPTQRKRHCYHYALRLVRDDIKAARQAAEE